MKTLFLTAAAVALLGSTAPAVAQDYYGRGYDRYESTNRDRWRIDRRDALRIAQRQGVRVDRIDQRGRLWDIWGRDRRGVRVHMQIDVRTGQVVRFDRQWDDRRWDRDDRRDHDGRDRRRDRDDDDDDDDDD